MNITYPITVFYDGACGVCSTEITYYRIKADERVVFVDIAAQDFDAACYNKVQTDFQKELHVCDSAGQFFTGVEAFRRLWEAIPSPFYPLLSSFVGLPGINLAARTGYRVFARFRHLLPGTRTGSCPLPRDGTTKR